MKFCLPAVLLFVLLQGCSNELPEPSKTILNKMTDLIYRCDTTCEGKMQNYPCKTAVRWLMGERKDGHEYHLVEVTCCEGTSNKHVFRFEIRNDSVLGPEVAKNKTWVSVPQHWTGPEKYGFVESITSDERKMLGWKREIYKGHVVVYTKNAVITCDTLYWDGRDYTLRAPNAIIENFPTHDHLTGDHLEFDANGTRLTIQNVKGQYVLDSLKK